MELLLRYSRGAAWKMPLDKHELREIVTAMLESIAFEPASLDLLVTDDEGIAWYNRQYLGCSGPTNILSFPPDTPGHVAALVLSVETLLRECLLYGQEPVEHTIRLLAHGVVHIAGHDHGDVMAYLEDVAAQSACVALGIKE